MIEEEKYKPFWITIIIIMNIIYTAIYFNANEELAIMILIVMISMNILFWLYCFICVLVKDFKRDVNKIVWFFSLLIIPPTYIIFIDIEKVQTVKK